MSFSIAAAKAELATPDPGVSSAAAARAPGVRTTVTFPTYAGCRLTMVFVDKNTAPECGRIHTSTGCRSQPKDRIRGALPLTNYLIRILARDSRAAQEVPHMTHQRAWEAMAEVLLHRESFSTGVPATYTWQTRLRVKAVALELMWALDPASDAETGGGPLGRAIARFTFNITDERKAQEPRLARVPRLLADLSFAPADSVRFDDLANRLVNLGLNMVDDAEQYEGRTREWFVRLLTGFHISIYEIVADQQHNPPPDFL